MKIKLTQLKNFAKDVDHLIKKKALLDEDFGAFKKMLSENPESGNLIQGTGGIRKIRLKSATKGKRGGQDMLLLYS